MNKGMFERVAKLCQRQIYSWLSSRCGLPICICALLLAFISTLQFGEVFLEWSKERYEAQFSIYADNLVAKSFEKELSPELPIDIVYTWVNGSDPKLLAELRHLKRDMSRENDVAAGNDNNSTHSSNTTVHQQNITCPFQHCVTWRCLILDARNTSQLTVDTVRNLSPLLRRVEECTYVNSTSSHTTPVYAIRLPLEQEVTTCLKHGLIRDREGRNMSVTRGFLTTDGNLAGVVKMDGYALLTSAGIRNSSKFIRKWTEGQFGRNVTEVEAKNSGIAVAKFRPGSLEHVLKVNNSYRFSGETLTIHQAYLVWLPFSLPEDEENLDGDDFSANRFEDNEELRYSLRSVEKYAPWIRKVFIVTNGQIPFWLNLDNPRLIVVTHEEIFPNRSHLPTYSSPAIETHLHRIPGLSKRFIYLNDDVMFGDYVWPEDFYTPQRGQKVYLSWPVPSCAEGCPSNWILDHYCDTACNNSACDWDGGDCVNATGPGWQFGYQPWSHTAFSPAQYCNTGCITSWLGDRYCDQSCRVPDCGYDAGDCGTEHFEELFSIKLNKTGGNYDIPLGTIAMFFNLTDLFGNGTITSAEYSSCELIRTAVVAQTFKTLSLTFSRNVTRSVTNITIAGTTGSGSKLVVSFNLTGDTATKNESFLKKSNYSEWSFPNYSDTRSQEFLNFVAMKIQNADTSLNYRVTERPPLSLTSPPPTTYTNYTISNISLLPENISRALKALEQEYKEGDLTEKGFFKKRVQLLEPVRHLVAANGSVYFGPTAPTVETTAIVSKDGIGKTEPINGVGVNRLPHVELIEQDAGAVHLGRRLMGTTQEEIQLPEWVARGKHKELTRDHDLKRAVEEWERRYGPWDPRYSSWESRRRLPWEKHHLFPEDSNQRDDDTDSDPYTTAPRKTRKLMDIYGDSLRHVNSLLNRAYGHDARKVPAHMPHMINREVMDELHLKYPEEFERTSSHKLRSSDDMQFAFSYFYFLMSEKKVMKLEEVFAELDTDKSGILSVRELRTLLTQISDLPLDLQTVNRFEDLLRECDKQFNGTHPSVDPIEFETHYDPDLPLVTLEFSHKCQPLIEKLNSTFKSRPKYKFEEVGEGNVAFQMISENASKVMQQLDEIRRTKTKFICLNDNIDHTKEGSHLAKLVLLDLYESLYPIPSQFELSPQYRNRFLHTADLNEWMVFRNRIQLLLHLACAVLLVLCIVSLFYGKIVQWKRKITRVLVSYLRMERTRPPSV